MKQTIRIIQFIPIKSEISRGELFLGLINAQIGDLISLNGIGVYKVFDSNSIRLTSPARRLGDSTLKFYFIITDKEVEEDLKIAVEEYMKGLYDFTTKEDSA